MAQHSRLIAVALSLALMTGCASTFEASYDHDSAHDFTTYETFSWISKNPMKVGQSVRVPNPLLEPRISSAIEKALVAKGFKYVIEPEKADFVLSFTIGSREEISVDSYPSMSAGVGMGYPSHWGWGGMYYGVGTETRVRQYTEGMLAIDIFDVKDRRPVWHGVATKRISDADRDDAEATINAAVDSVLAAFPPPQD